MWVTKDGRCYEYIAISVDDLMFAMVNPEAFEKPLREDYIFKLKGTGEIDYHIGMDFFWDEDGILCINPAKYIEKIMHSYKRMFGTAPSTCVYSPLKANEHPKLDNAELLDAEGT